MGTFRMARWTIFLIFLLGARTASADSVSCGMESTLKSLRYDQALSMTFENRSSFERDLYWLNYTGKRVIYTKLAPGSTYSVNTFVTHPWVITDSSGTCLDIRLPDPAAPNVVISN